LPVEENPAGTIYLRSTLDYYTVLSSENYNEYLSIIGAKSGYLKSLEKYAFADPYIQYYTAEIYLQSALLQFKFTDYVKGALDAKRALQLYEEGYKHFPNYLMFYKGLGMLKVSLSVIPENFTKILKMIGVEGNKTLGFQLFDKVLDYEKDGKRSIWFDEALLTYSMAILQFASPQNGKIKAKECIDLSKDLVPNSLLKTYIQLQMYKYLSQNEAIIQAYQNRAKGYSYAEVPQLDYYYAVALLQKMDKNTPLAFEKFLSSQSSFSKQEALLRLGWWYYIHFDNKAYFKTKEDIFKIKQCFSESDENALAEVQQPLGNINILKARITFDGGYFTQALSYLSEVDTNSLNTQDKLNYYYRLGRTEQCLKHWATSIEAFEKVIVQPNVKGTYIYANSLLQLGEVNEEKGNIQKAKYHYLACLEAKGHPYKNSIDIKAKAGLARLR
jgi:hypothetical protein